MWNNNGYCNNCGRKEENNEKEFICTVKCLEKKQEEEQKYGCKCCEGYKKEEKKEERKEDKKCEEVYEEVDLKLKLYIRPELKKEENCHKHKENC